jgi:hypothetical protein
VAERHEYSRLPLLACTARRPAAAADRMPTCGDPGALSAVYEGLREYLRDDPNHSGAWPSYYVQVQ